MDWAQVSGGGLNEDRTAVSVNVDIKNKAYKTYLHWI